MKKEKLSQAYYTVEASIIFPFILIMFFFFTSMCVLEYNRVLLSGDTYFVLEKGREAALENKDYQKEMNKSFKIIKNETPFISCKNLKMSYSKHGNKLSVDASVQYAAPISKYLKLYLFKSPDMILQVSKSVSINKAQNIMRMTYKFKEDE